jgi:hypothetical protein
LKKSKGGIKMAEMWNPQPREVYKSWLEAIYDEAEEKLTSWERDFINSIAQRLSLDIPLTEKQARILEQIYAEKTK